MLFLVLVPFPALIPNRQFKWVTNFVQFLTIAELVANSLILVFVLVNLKIMVRAYIDSIYESHYFFPVGAHYSWIGPSYIGRL